MPIEPGIVDGGVPHGHRNQLNPIGGLFPLNIASKVREIKSLKFGVSYRISSNEITDA